MGTSIEDWQAFRRAGDAGRLTVRIMAYAAGPGDDADRRQAEPWLYRDKLRLNGVKLYLDGALGSRGAWLKAPYADDPGTHGPAADEPVEFRNTQTGGAAGSATSSRPMRSAMPPMRKSLNAIAEVSGSAKGDRRWRIEHAQVVDARRYARFGQGTASSPRCSRCTRPRTA